VRIGQIDGNDFSEGAAKVDEDGRGGHGGVWSNPKLKPRYSNTVDSKSTAPSVFPAKAGIQVLRDRHFLATLDARRSLS
jgi:hypothetical protein